MTAEKATSGKAVISHFESIVCPECEQVQPAVVKHTVPWHSRVHVCQFCQHTIMESEWVVEDAKTHTKGPWAFEERPYTNTGSMRHVVFQEANRNRIATVSKNGVESYATSKANAALLAAAPDLLEACKAALKWRQPSEVKEQLIKAVEKAEKDNEQSRAKALYEIADSAYQRAVAIAARLHNTETP